MRPEWWPEVDAIVAEALDLAPADRAAFVHRACAGQPQIAAEVNSLLRAGAAAGVFLEGHTLSKIDPDAVGGPHAPQRVGPYRLLEEVGHGGMSVVYRAERDDGQFRKQAAVKLLAAGWISPDAMRRFIGERQILAALDHPNIGRLLDGGITEGGVPYLVMDFVDGVPLLDYCRDHQLDQRARLELFRKICRAVQYAHQNLIVHRDIKPGNVLVTREGEVKLMDFGIAKVLAESGGSGETQTHFPAMTPDYASPEQINGQQITTQSDIYSLGVLLYELLTGKRPYLSAGKSMAELLRLISETEAPAAPGLPVELLAIVRCAMSKEPGGRYVTVLSLDDDVERYLSRKPVRAISPSRWYLMRKWIGRHRASVLAGTVAVIVIMAASVFALWSATVARRERAIAEQRFRDVQRLANKVLFDYPVDLRRMTASVNLQLRMATDSLQYLDDLSRSRPSDPTLLLELARGYIQMGVILGTPRTSNLGQPEKALESYTKARQILEELIRLHPDLAEARRELAALLRRLSGLDTANAADFALHSLALYEEVHRRAPQEYDLFSIGWAHIRLAELDLQSDHAHQAIQSFQALLAAHPDYVEGAHQEAYAYRLLGRGRFGRNDAAGALEAEQMAKSLDERARSLLSNPDAYTMEISLDVQLMATAYLRLDHLAESRKLFQQAADLRRRVFQVSQGNAWVQNNFLEALCWLGWSAERLGDGAAAHTAYREAIRLMPSLTAAQPADDDWNTVFGFIYGGEGLLLQRERHAGCPLIVRAAGYFRAVHSFEWPDFRSRAATVERTAAGCPK